MRAISWVMKSVVFPTFVFNRFGTIFKSTWYIFTTLCTKLQTGHTCNAASPSFKICHGAFIWIVNIYHHTTIYSKYTFNVKCNDNIALNAKTQHTIFQFSRFNYLLINQITKMFRDTFSNRP
jgi:hypothetical protein